MADKRPDKHPDVLKEVRACVEKGKVLDTRHATDRRSEREITFREMLDVLLTGYHEKRKDKWDEFYKAWNYAIRGKTTDRRELRVIASFDPNGLLIITAIDLDK